MSILGDIINKRVSKIAEERVVEKQEVKEEPVKSTMYNKIWLARVAEEHGFALTENEFRIGTILKKLNERDGHCPCGGMTEDFICPCKMMREYGACKCGLYQNVRDVVPKNGSSTAKIKE